MSEESTTPSQPTRPRTGRGPRSWSAILLPWLLALILGLAAGLATRLYLAARAEVAFEQMQANLADLELRSARDQLEAETLLERREVADLKKELEAARSRGSTP
jgi:cell division protein FtsB